MKLGDLLPEDLRKVGLRVKSEIEQKVERERGIISKALVSYPPLCQLKLFANGAELIISFYTPMQLSLIPTEFNDSLTILLYASKLVTILEQDRPSQALMARLSKITNRKFLSFPAIVRKPRYNRELLKPLFNIQVIPKTPQS